MLTCAVCSYMHEAKNDDGTPVGPEEIEDDLTNLLYVDYP
jgi:hypothetical protein